MNHRERVLATLRHQEPDRVPLDLGSTNASGILAVAYPALRNALRLRPATIQVGNVTQQTALVHDDVREVLGIDTAPIFPEPRTWRAGRLTDGSAAELPARFQPQRRPDGSEVVLDSAGGVVLLRPPTGLYFERVVPPLADATSPRDIERHLDTIRHYDRAAHLDRSWEEMGEVARRLRETTDYCLVGFCGGHIFQAAQSLRGWETFLIDLLVNPVFAEALLDALAEAHMANFTRFAETIGPYVDVMQFADDLGMQDRPLVSPELYRRRIKPYHARLYRYARSKCSAYLLMHSDGAIVPLIPDLIEIGVDALNPIQVSAAGMDTRQLKREFGASLSFWGGACDSQSVLPYGTPSQVEDEVRRRIDDLAPGGGFVLAPIHNIQYGAPAENILALFRTALAHGRYHP